MAKKKHKEKFRRLQRAVEALYSAAFWTPDRELPNEADLWTELRDAAELDKGTKMGLLVQGLSSSDLYDR